MRIGSWPESEVPPDLREQVLALQRQAWPPDESIEPSTTHDPALEPLSMLLVADGRVLSALDILSKDITHQGRRFAASGLSTVVTDEALRGRGFGRRLVEAAHDMLAAGGRDLGIFTCDRPLQAFYERAGWKVFRETVLVGGTPAAPFPSDRFDKVTIGDFFSAKGRRFADTFIGARIDLYPGEVDKLW